jgi:hypothetical protein
MHDADPHGYNIGRTLKEETARMPDHRIEVIDLGLRLEQALEMGLSTEEFTRKKKIPQGLTLTDLERDYFEGRHAGQQGWICRRVELNALSGPDLIAFTEDKLRQAGVRGKVIPHDADLRERLRTAMREITKDSVTREWQSRIDAEVERRMAAFEPTARGEEELLRGVVSESLSRQPVLSWHESVAQVARRILNQPEA